MFEEAPIEVGVDSPGSSCASPELPPLKVRGPLGLTARVLRPSWPPPPELGLVGSLRELCESYALGEPT